MKSLRDAKSEIATKEAEATSWRQKTLRLEEQCDQLQSDLAHKQTILQKAEHELHSLRSTAVDNEILTKLEEELNETKREAENQRQKLRELHTNYEQSNAAFSKSQSDVVELKSELTLLAEKLDDSEAKRQQLEQKRVDEIRRLRDDHRVEIDQMRREFLDEKERIEEKVSMAEEDAKKAQLNAEETRKSIEEAQKRLANALNCPTNFDLMLKTIYDNQHKFDELESQLKAKDSNRHVFETQLNEELNRSVIIFLVKTQF